MVTSKGSSKHSSEVSATTIYSKTEIEKIAESLNIDGITEKIENQALNIDGINAKIENQDLNIDRINAKIGNQFLNQSMENAMIKKQLLSQSTDTHDMEAELSQLKQNIEDLSHTGSWCAQRDEFSGTSQVIKYEKTSTADSNMNKNALNLGTGET